MAITHDIILEMNKSTALVPPCVVVRVGDVASQTIKAQLQNDGASYTPTGSARLDILKADGTWARCTATISGSTVSCTLPSQAVSSPGTARLAHFVFYTGTTRAESTEGFELRILPAVDTSDPEEAAEYYDDMLTKLYEKWEAYEKKAESQEAARVTAEKNRVTEFNTLKSQSQAATNAANGAATNANNAATYARSVADSLQSSVVGDEDVAEMRGQIDKLGSMLADSSGDFFYMDGTIYAPSAKASVSGTTVTLGSTCSASGNTITLA